ncbi:MAG: hypothetical protein C5B50_11525 [Verrucomicrobia bacterium]|nr:MAG: hypothetical protein C5B50_11525 [Verrucomicrobiota bacterium]
MGFGLTLSPSGAWGLDILAESSAAIHNTHRPHFSILQGPKINYLGKKTTGVKTVRRRPNSGVTGISLTPGFSQVKQPPKLA